MYRSEYLSLGDARAQLRHFIEEVYNRNRIHSSLDFQTPAETEAQWLQRNSLKVSGILCPM